MVRCGRASLRALALCFAPGPWIESLPGFDRLRRSLLIQPSHTLHPQATPISPAAVAASHTHRHIFDCEDESGNEKRRETRSVITQQRVARRPGFFPFPPPCFPLPSLVILHRTTLAPHSASVRSEFTSIA